MAVNKAQKVSEKKAAQGYRLTPMKCSNCSLVEERIYHYENHVDERGILRRVKVEGKGSGKNFFIDSRSCTIGNFSVRPMATRNLWDGTNIEEGKA